MKYKTLRPRFVVHQDELNVNKILGYLNKATSVIKNFSGQNLDGMPNDAKIQTLDKVERVAMALRSSLEICKENFEMGNTSLSEDLPLIEISLTDNILRIKTPLTTVRNKNNSSFIAKSVLSSLDIFEEENNIRLSDIFKEPVTVTQIRKIRKVQYEGCGYIKDNNNEDSKIINAVLYDKFLKSDNVYYLRSFTNTTEAVEKIEDVGMEFIIAPFKEQKH